MDNINSITAATIEREGRYEYYPLDSGKNQRLIPYEHELVVNTVTGHITLVDWEQMHFQAQCRFTPFELPLIRQLFEDWPDITPYEQFISLLFSTTLAAQMFQCLRTAREQGDPVLFAVVIEPLRAVLYQCQERLRLFGLQIGNDAEQGYHLIALTHRKLAEEYDK